MNLIASIIITNYNYGKYIAKCIRSCINQNLEKSKYEIIIVDDKSSDNSINKINEYKKSFNNLLLIQNSKNLGVARSTNKALKIAKGKYVVRVDADDYVNKNFLSVLTLFLEENKDYFSVACDYYLVDNLERKISKVNSIEKPISCGVLYNKKKLLALGGYDPNFRHREEEELRLRVYNKGYKSFNLNLPLYRYLMHGNNKTKSKDFKKKYKNKIKKLTFNNKLSDFNKHEKKYLKNIVAIIPARGGSKRLKNKNLQKIWGKPMISWCINAAKKSNYIKKLYVSSENDKILNFCKKLSVNIVKRPSELSEDNVFKIDVVKHAIKYLKIKPSLVISLQPNSPDILSSDLDRGIEKLLRYNLNEIISVDNNGIQNAAFRIMKYDTLFQKSLSTHCGFVITDSSDIHTREDLKLVEKNKTYENK